MFVKDQVVSSRDGGFVGVVDEHTDDGLAVIIGKRSRVVAPQEDWQAGCSHLRPTAERNVCLPCQLYLFGGLRLPVHQSRTTADNALRILTGQDKYRRWEQLDDEAATLARTGNPRRAHYIEQHWIPRVRPRFEVPATW